MPQKRSTNEKNATKKNKPKRTTSSEEENENLTIKKDILGVVIAAIAIALLIAVFTPSDAIVTGALHDFLTYGFGVGSILIPVAMIIWAISFFVNRKEGMPVRPAIGLILIAFAAITITALLTPNAQYDPTQTLNEAYVTTRGGYVGGAIAWLLLSLLGREISIVLMVSLIIAGFILLGFSISGFIQSSTEKIKDIKDAKDLPFDEPKKYTQKTALFKRKPDNSPVEEQLEADFSNDKTTYLGDRSKTRILAPDNNKTKILTKKKKGSRKKTRTSVFPSAEPQATEGFVLPPMDILEVEDENFSVSEAQRAELEGTKIKLQEALDEFGSDGTVVGWTTGPTVTTFEVEPGEGERLNKIVNLEDDIALALAAQSVRIFAPIPGTSLIGIEIPNENRSLVRLGDVINHTSSSPLSLAIGRDVEGNPVTADLSKMPHLLIGGTTGSGKSVMINSLITTILMKTTPDEVRLIMIDPKRVELAGYNGIPHLYVPVVTDPHEAASALQWAVAEMERRLKIFEKAGARNIGSFNKMVQDNKFEDVENPPEQMPYLVIIIDELSDLMMVAGKDVEGSIIRISQLGRAPGVHLVVATQRPAAEIVTNAIKVNIINRIAFSVATAVDSRVILDQKGAEKLIGYGDMLFSRPEWGKPLRVQSCFVSDEEIEAVVNHLVEQGEPDYHPEILSTVLESAKTGVMASTASTGRDETDPLLWDAADLVVQMGAGSTSGLQRRLSVGYARAGRIMDMLEERGIVGPPNGSKPRNLLIDEEELQQLKDFEFSEPGEGEVIND